MVKYATAIRTGTASTEAILRRFMKANAAHPTYQAMIELGRAQKTNFLCRYLRSRELQREIEEGLNVVESWNRANSVIYYGKAGELSSNRVDEQELSVQCLRIVQASLVYVNTLMIQDLIDDPDTGDILVIAADKRGVTPLIWEHVLPYGEVKLNMNKLVDFGFHRGRGRLHRTCRQPRQRRHPERRIRYRCSPRADLSHRRRYTDARC
jgi:Tn3 transposase DDE domain